MNACKAGSAHSNYDRRELKRHALGAKEKIIIARRLVRKKTTHSLIRLVMHAPDIKLL
jgi:hypothetical protein